MLLHPLRGVLLQDNPMSIKVMTAVWDSDLETTRKFILLFYADRASDDGENVWPAISTVAKKTGFSTRTIQRVTTDMVKEGLLFPDGKGKKGTNRYNINIVALNNQGGDTVSPCQPRQKGVTLTTEGGDIDDKGGDIACHPNHPLTILELEPSLNHPDSEHKKMFGQIASLCCVDPKLKGGQIGKAAKELLKAGYTSDSLETFTTWWKADWRGKHPPTIQQVLDNILVAIKESNPPIKRVLKGEWGDDGNFHLAEGETL
jgi:hypothetical protein